MKRSAAFVATLLAVGFTVGATGIAHADTQNNTSRQAAAASASSEPEALVTFEVGDDNERYRVKIKGESIIDEAQRLLEGAQPPATIPHGQIVKAASPDNPGYNWHIASDGFSFTEVGAIECDSVPQLVTPGYEVWEFGYYCPWSARVAEVELIA
ncbi:BP74-related protein [Streptomyces vinaceus]